MADPREAAYLIIGGTTKAATTSLHRYLSDHPGVCGSSMKETRFFLDADYPLPSKYRWTDGVEHYEEFYRHGATGLLRVEATPDYLYSEGTPARLRSTLPHARMLFILREPTDRLVSWYRFARQSNQLPAGLPFAEYVARQLREPVGTATPQPLRALGQGCYAPCLARYLEIFSAERVQVVYFEDLAASPQLVMTVICQFARLDPGRFADYSFEEANRSQAMRYPALHRAYVRMRFLVRQQTHHRRWIHEALRGVRRAAEPLYLRLNRAGGTAPLISPDLRARLAEYYAEDRDRLRELLGVAPPWGAIGEAE